MSDDGDSVAPEAPTPAIGRWQDLEHTLLAAAIAYEEAATSGMGVDYEALGRTSSAQLTEAPIPPAVMRRLAMRRWLEEAGALLERALPCERQRLEYLTYVLADIKPRSQRELVLFRAARRAIDQELRHGLRPTPER